MDHESLERVKGVCRNQAVPEHIKEFLHCETLRFLDSMAQQPNQKQARVRKRLAEHGYRLMSRGRKGRFWVMYAEPQTLDDIEHWLNEEEAR